MLQLHRAGYIELPPVRWANPNPLDETDRLRRRQVERARNEADLARHRYMQVDAANRLIADVLEGLLLGLGAGSQSALRYRCIKFPI
jgi:hypothetical protein